AASTTSPSVPVSATTTSISPTTLLLIAEIALIVALPKSCANTVPLTTVATAVLEDSQNNVLLAPAGVNVTVNAIDVPTAIVSSSADNSIFVGAKSFKVTLGKTLILTSPLTSSLSLTNTVIVASPA